MPHSQPGAGPGLCPVDAAGCRLARHAEHTGAAVRQRQGPGGEQPVVIGADKDVRYERVMQVMDTLQRANVKRVGLLVKPAQG